MAQISRCEICSGALMPRALGHSVLSECAQCGHLLRDLQQAPAHHRDAAYGGDPALDAMRLALTYRLFAGSRAPESVFEIGFGSGGLLRKFLDDGAHVAGADPDQLHVDVDPLVRERGQLFTGGIEDVDLAGYQADLVYGIHVLEHVLDPMTTLRRARALLKPGGEAHFLTPAGDWAGLQVVDDGWWMLEDPTHIRFFTMTSLRRAAIAAGFSDVEVRRPVLDSIVHDAASVIRRVDERPRPQGVLSERRTMVAAATAAPLTLSARLVMPRLRPTLHLVAKA